MAELFKKCERCVGPFGCYRCHMTGFIRAGLTTEAVERIRERCLAELSTPFGAEQANSLAKRILAELAATARREAAGPPITTAGTDFRTWDRSNLERLALELTERVVRCPHCSGGAARRSPEGRG